MFIYLLEREDGQLDYEQTESCVVIARSGYDARRLAQAEFRSELPAMYSVWLDPSTKVKLLGCTRSPYTPGVVHSSFRNG